MNNKTEDFFIILAVLIIIGSVMYIYFLAHTFYPDTNSSRVQDLNWLLKTFGKTGTEIFFSLTGVIIMYSGIRHQRKKSEGIIPPPSFLHSPLW